MPKPIDVPPIPSTIIVLRHTTTKGKTEMQSIITAAHSSKTRPAENSPAAKAFAAGHTPPLVIAHRGFSALFPENTLPAFEAAISACADMIEFDVRLTRDNRLVVIHDETVDRTTNGQGRVRDLSLGELYHLDAGSWFGPAFAGTRIPSLESALKDLAGHCLINLELKPLSASSYSERSALACNALGMVRSRGLMDDTLFSCFDHGMLRLMRRLEPRVNLGVLAEGPLDLDSALGLVRELDVVSLHPHADLLEPALVQAMHALGVLILAWTSRDRNNEASMERALELGADGFFANDVNALRASVERFRSK